jgi:hypothetical protein
MAERVLKIWYIKEADILEVFWGDKSNYLAGTEHERVLADVDTKGNLQGFQVHGVTRLGDDLLEIPVPAPDNLENAEKPQKSRPER